MKRSTILVLTVAMSIIFIAASCKTVGRIAAKYWLKREINEFVSNCESKTGKLVGRDNAHKYCDCAVDIVAEEYHNYQDAKNIPILEILDFINKCK